MRVRKVSGGNFNWECINSGLDYWTGTLDQTTTCSHACTSSTCTNLHCMYHGCILFYVRA